MSDGVFARQPDGRFRYEVCGIPAPLSDRLTAHCCALVTLFFHPDEVLPDTVTTEQLETLFAHFGRGALDQTPRGSWPVFAIESHLATVFESMRVTAPTRSECEGFHDGRIYVAPTVSIQKLALWSPFDSLQAALRCRHASFHATALRRLNGSLQTCKLAHVGPCARANVSTKVRASCQSTNAVSDIVELVFENAQSRDHFLMRWEGSATVGAGESLPEGLWRCLREALTSTQEEARAAVSWFNFKSNEQLRASPPAICSL